MTLGWGEAMLSATADVVFDAAQAEPDVVRAVCDASPAIGPALERLRAGSLPLMSTAAPGEQGDLYRMRGHNRSVCLALGPDKSTADVIVLKGSEPLLPDFDAYLEWMRSRQFGNWPRPIMEHFPLSEGKAPGTVFLDEALSEAELALKVQARHLRHYGGLMRLPVPLFVFRLPAGDHARVVELLRAKLSEPAFERVGPHLDRGIGVFAYYYPGPPARVNAVGRPRFLWPATQDLTARSHVLETMVPGWIRLAARLLWLGFLPSTPLSWRLGTIFDPNNTCLDGGACDVGSIYPMEQAPNDAFFTRSIVMEIGSLRVVVARAFGIPLGEIAQTYEQEVVAYYLGRHVECELERALAAEARASLTLDPRVTAVFGGEKSLPDLLRLFQQFSAYLGTADYAP